MKSFKSSLLTGVQLGFLAFVSQAQVEHVDYDSQGIDDFALYTQGGLWWDKIGVCPHGGEFPESHEATISVRAADMTFGTKTLARDCEILTSARDKVVRDDHYIKGAMKGGRFLERKKL